MTHIEKQIQRLCREICKMQSDGRCVFCGDPAEAHHLFFDGKHRANWQARTDPDYFTALCGKCHRHAKFAPHVNATKFWKKLAKHIEPKKMCKILDMKYALRTFEKPDCKDIHASLVEQYKKLKETHWMDADIEPEYGRVKP